MAVITFTIPDAKIQRVVDAMKNMHPIPFVKDAETGEMLPQFTDNQWAKECIRRHIISEVARWEQKKAQSLISYSPDDTLAN